MSRRRLHPLHLAGWLFADMLLVLALIAMGDQGDPVRAAARPAPSGPPTPSGSATPKPSRPAGPRAVEKSPVKVAVDAAPGDTDRMVERLRQATAAHRGRQAAIVLTFGRTRSADAGIAYARRVNSLLTKARPEMFEGTTTRDFMNLGGDVGHADLEIYFYTH